jgi:hypothetical protein
MTTETDGNFSSVPVWATVTELMGQWLANYFGG